MKLPLDHVLEGEFHVVSEVIESELIVRPVHNVAPVCFTAFLVVHVVDNHADRQPQETVDGPHPLRVSFRQVVVHGDYVNSFPGKSIQIDGQGGGECLTLTSLHLGDLALMQDEPPYELNVEMPHAKSPD